MTSRRKFLQQSAILGAAGLLVNKSGFANEFFGPRLPAPGIQLFTFFNDIDNDLEGTLKKISEVGYKAIESAFSKKGGYYGMKAKEFNSYIESLGMKWRSHHVIGAPFKLPPGAKMPAGPDGKPITIPPMRNLTDNMKELVDEAAEGGVPYLVCANTPINTMDDIKASIEMLNKTDEYCKKVGIGFAYHNHDAEFRAVEGQLPYEMFLSQTKMKMELDLAWATKGGKDPVELFKQHPGRFPLWHVKDLDEKRETILPVGEGTINYKRIFENASSSGLVNYFVEHDMPKDAWASVKKSIETVRKF